MYSTDDIKALLNTSNAAVERGLLVLLDRQTADEQATQATSHQNGMGFSAFDAEILTSFAQQIQVKMANGRKLGQCLSEKQMALARKKITRYAKQLAGVANEKAAAQAPTTAAPAAQTAADYADAISMIKEFQAA